MRRPSLFWLSLLVCSFLLPALAEPPAPSRDLFAVPQAEFAVTRTARPESSGRLLRCERISFPSPVQGKIAANNTVYGFLYTPKLLETRRALILLPIWKGPTLTLEHSLAQAIATYGFKVLVMPAAYQHERKPPGVGTGRWTISDDIIRTRGALTQTVKDAIRARRWMLESEGVDRLAIGGVSLGGILAALAYGVEERFDAGVFLMAGGDLGRLLYVSAETTSLRKSAIARGFSLTDVQANLRAVEPLSYASKKRGAGVLIFAGTEDRSIPPDHARKLAAAYGVSPRWFPAGHYTAAPWLPRAVRLTVSHLSKRLGPRIK